MDWLQHTFLFNYDFFAFGYATWQAGVNMIPGLGWQQALEAWASDKVKED